MPLTPNQPIDEFVGMGTYSGQAVDGLTMSLTYIRPPRCERDQLWVEGEGEVYITGNLVEEGWPGIDGPAMFIGVFPVDATSPLVWGLGGAAPINGQQHVFEYLRAAVAECGEEWSETTKITVSPEIVNDQ